MGIKWKYSKIQPWVVWGFGSFLGLFTFLLQGSPSVMIYQLKSAYHIDVLEIGILTSSFFYSYIALQIPAGMILDLWGPRRILTSGFFLSSLAIGWFALSRFFWEGQVSRIFMGMGNAPIIIGAFALSARWFPPHLFLFLVAVTESIVLGGGIIGEGGLAACVAKLGWRETMFALSIIGLILTGLCLLIIHDSPKKDETFHDGEGLSSAIKKTGKNFIKTIKIPQVWLSGLYCGLAFSPFPAFAALWGIPFLVRKFEVSIPEAAMVASTFFIGGFLGTFFTGLSSLLIKRRRYLMIIGSLAAAICSLIILYCPFRSLFPMFVLYFLMGLFASTYALSYAFVGGYVPRTTKGVAMGFTNMLGLSIGAPILQPLIGFLLEKSALLRGVNNPFFYAPSDYAFALTPIPICLTLAFVVALFVKEPKIENARP